ncbi:MAG: carboxypeptidase regulatory-like domain-containing protein, partial [Planctomycetes bacterium]|nr:carboxypeptidase regulatory-like domain-containing protein [Planctomycetota bacterium]
DNAESPLRGVTIHLLDSEGQIVAMTTTDIAGRYKFENLPPGRYSIRQVQPSGYFDGSQRPGSHGGDTSVPNLISAILVPAGESLTDYDFCEVPPSSLSGLVHVDANQNCRFDNGEAALGGVTIRLLDSDGKIVATTTTDAAGRYRFANLPAGRYSVQQVQPADLFDGSQRSGSHGGDTSVPNLISAISVEAGESLFDYDFCELPPSALSGYVFQDGDPLVSMDGRLPADARTLRAGSRTSDDTPLTGVTMELLDAATGEPIHADSGRVLPGTYPSGPVTVVTDAQGHYHFPGLLPGSYAVRETQPETHSDGVDTPGTFSEAWYAENVDLNSIAPWIAPDSTGDADVLLVMLPAGETSVENNFSEILVRPFYPFDWPSPVVPTPPPFLADILASPPPAAPLIVASLAPPALEIDDTGTGGMLSFSWHLSIIDAGNPRGRTSSIQPNSVVWRNTAFRPPEDWDTMRVTEGYWTLHTRGQQGTVGSGDLQRKVFGMHGAIPVAADFNGDGIDELGIYYQGRWMLDLNGNGRWDDEDLWAQLGGELDLPICGDWNGDGKDDIGIFG